MASRQNNKMTTQKVDQHGKLTKWRVDKMASRQSGKMTTWKVDKNGNGYIES